MSRPHHGYTHCPYTTLFRSPTRAIIGRAGAGRLRPAPLHSIGFVRRAVEPSAGHHGASARRHGDSLPAGRSLTSPGLAPVPADRIAPPSTLPAAAALPYTSRALARLRLAP